MVKLFVGNVPLGASADELQAKFEQFGHVDSCDIVKEFAFVHMPYEDEAATAIEKLNHSVFRGQRLVVELGREETGTRRREKPEHLVNGVKLYVRNIDPSVSVDQLQSLFEKCGEVLRCDIVKEFAFVHMRGGKAATNAIESLNKTKFAGRTITVELSHDGSGKSGAGLPEVKLHVSRIDPKSCTSAELKELFEEFGVVTQCDIVKDFAFVHMRGERAAQNAISALNRTQFKGNTIIVAFSKSNRHSRAEHSPVSRNSAHLVDMFPPGHLYSGAFATAAEEEMLIRRGQMLLGRDPVDILPQSSILLQQHSAAFMPSRSTAWAEPIAPSGLVPVIPSSVYRRDPYRSISPVHASRSARSRSRSPYRARSPVSRDSRRYVHSSRSPPSSSRYSHARMSTTERSFSPRTFIAPTSPYSVSTGNGMSAARGSVATLGVGLGLGHAAYQRTHSAAYPVNSSRHLSMTGLPDRIIPDLYYLPHSPSADYDRRGMSRRRSSVSPDNGHGFYRTHRE